MCGTGWDGDRLAHNPEVAGTNPTPATKARGRFSNREPTFCVPDANVAGQTPCSLAPITSMDASRPPMISSASVLATCLSASRSVWTYCFIVNATSAWPIRLLGAFREDTTPAVRQHDGTELLGWRPTGTLHYCTRAHAAELDQARRLRRRGPDVSAAAQP